MTDEEKKEKPKFVKLRAEFNAAQEFLREVLRVVGEINRIAVYAKSGYKEYNKFYFALVHQLYTTICGILAETEIVVYKERFNKLLSDFDNPTVKIAELPFRIDDINRELMVKMQKSGFFVPMSSVRKGAIHFRDLNPQDIDTEHGPGDE